VALAIGAHPDDVEFGCGATLAKWAAAGCIVHHLVCTDGSKGTWDPGADIVALAARRQVEQREAARRLAGARAGEVVFLEYVDGELGSDREAQSRIARSIRRLRPDVVLGHDPWKRYRLHPDHRHAGLLTCDAIVAARDPHFFPEHGVPHHRPRHLLLFEADEPDHVEDVSPWVDAKLAALEAHESQFESTMHAVDGSELDGFRQRIRTRLRELGSAHGIDAAEVFKRISDL
jgi:LmbE family N-acetylglucosaminyl deacetylase